MIADADAREKRLAETRQIFVDTPGTPICLYRSISVLLSEPYQKILFNAVLAVVAEVENRRVSLRC
jgi:hypothetical protein